MQTNAPAQTPHPFDRYISERQAADLRFSVTALCDLCGVSRSAYYRVINGAADVGNDLFEKFERGTNSAITAHELYAAWLHAKRQRELAEAGANQ